MNGIYKKSVALAALLTCLVSAALLLGEIGGKILLQSTLRGGFFIPTVS